MALTPPLLAALLAASIQLPGGPPVGMDIIVYDRANNRIWVPAGNTGNVDVVDVATGKLTVLGGFPTAPPRRPGRPRMGPSSAAVGDGVVWIGNRGNNQLLAFNARTLASVGTVQLEVMPDCLAYVGGPRQVWATTPADKGIKVISVDGKAPRVVADIKVEGSPEGYAVDESRGVFYTNLEDKDRTLAIDVRTRKVLSSWPATCGEEGPRGLALDSERRLLFVACTDGARVLDLANDGRASGQLKTGSGVDLIEYDARERRLFVASAKDGSLTIAQVRDGGALALEAVVPTGKGARNPVVDARGMLYVADSERGQLLVIDPGVDIRPRVDMHEQRPGLLAEAKISPDVATATAKAKLPRAELVSAEIEREHGKLIYSFDFKTAGRSGGDEVAVDATTGKVLSVGHESPSDEAREKAADAKAAAHKAAEERH
jgi:DNA-binding beta-propeller fold protein YncE